MNNKIELKEISKHYDQKINIKVLNNINFKFKTGKIYSLMGPSGSGKSTLLNLMSLIDRPTTGKIKIENRDINFNQNAVNDEIRANKIGIIYQEKNLLTDFTALENVYLARLSIDNDRNKAITDAKRIIKNVGLINRINHYPSELSGGENQRIAISRALINQPEIILADEPTGNLDSTNGQEVMTLLSDLNAGGTTVIMVTHSATDAEYAHRVINLFDGQVVSENINSKENSLV